MLNSVSDPAVRRRLSADDRRRQLVGIGLARIVDTPIQDLSIDAVAAEAGISRGLLFHYFPTKTDFYLACIAAAGRRMLRTTAPDEELPGEQQVEMVTRLMVEQIERRRDGGPGAHLVGGADRRTPGLAYGAGRGVRRRAPRPARPEHVRVGPTS